MKRSLFVLAAVLTTGLVVPVLAADTYMLDAAHSNVGFAVRHLVISTVNGHFSEVAGEIQYDAADITKSSVSVTIKTDSINTNNGKRDDHLKSADFFDAEKNPEITFKSSSIEREGDGYAAVGTLTIKGVSKEVKLPFEITGKIKDPWGNNKIGVEGSLTINRQDYGVSWSKTMDNGGLVVGNEVKISFSVEAAQKM